MLLARPRCIPHLTYPLMLQALLYIELPRIAEFRLALATEMGGLLLTECGNQGSLARRAGVSISWAQGGSARGSCEGWERSHGFQDTCSTGHGFEGCTAVLALSKIGLDCARTHMLRRKCTWTYVANSVSPWCLRRR